MLARDRHQDGHRDEKTENILPHYGSIKTEYERYAVELKSNFGTKITLRYD